MGYIKKWIYIAGKIGDNPPLDVIWRFEVVSRILLDNHRYPINPLWIALPIYRYRKESVNYRLMLLKFLCVADEIHIIPSDDIHRSKGVKLEVEKALDLNIPVRVIKNLNPYELSNPLDSWSEVVKLSETIKLNFDGFVYCPIKYPERR